MTFTRNNISSSSPFAKKLGFSRAVRVGPMICIGGTAPIGEDGQTVGIGDAALQTERCFEIIEQALNSSGATLKHVTRTRIMLTNINDWAKVAEIRARYLKDIKPVDTVVEVSKFINPEWLVEIEVDAVVDG